MNALSFLLIVAVIVSVVSSLPQKYSSKYDNVDVDSILNNERLLSSYVKCLLDKGPCTQEGRDFRKNLPDAISTKCAKCTEGQKKIVRKAARHMMQKKKTEWEQIKNKYDPKGEHYDAFLKFLDGN